MCFMVVSVSNGACRGMPHTWETGSWPHPNSLRLALPRVKNCRSWNSRLECVPVRKNTQNYCLLLVLTFLQCLVPLLHAHAGGLHVTSHVHVHADGLELSASRSAHELELKADLSDSPVVGAASEFRRDSANDGFTGAPPATPWLTVQYSTYVVVIASPSILPYIPFLAGPPPSQAPPALV